MWNMSDNERVSTSKSLKDTGNLLFQHHDYVLAMGKYLKAVEFCEGVTDRQLASNLLLSSYLNLSACALNTEQSNEAVRYATKALEIEPDNTKGLFRRGKAHLQLNNLEKAKEDLEMASTSSTDPQLKMEFAKVKKKLETAREKREKLLWWNV